MPESMSNGWYYLRSGDSAHRQVGPLTWEQLYGLGSSGSLRPDDLVWNAGLPQWLPANQIPGLAAAFPAMGYQQPWAAPGPRRPSWLWPVLIPLIALIVAGAGLGAYFGLTQGGDKTAAGDSAVATATTEAAIDLGKAEAQDGDPDLVVYTEEYGTGPADQVLVMMAEGSGRAETESVAAQLGGTIVGEVEYIQLYQIQTAGTTAEDLIAAIETASAQPGVEGAFPNAIMSEKATIEGKKCSPLRDPLYDDANAVPYEMIGLQRAWDILKASGVELNNVHLGIVDTAIYTKSGEGFGTELNFPDASGNYPEGKAQVSGLSAADTTDQPNPDMPGGLSHGTRVGHIMGADADNGGVVGVLGPVGGKVEMTASNFTSGPGKYQAPNPDPNDVTQYQGFFLKTLVELKKQVDDGATVINMSFGSNKPGPQNAWNKAAYERFFKQMQKDKPGVIFVAAAGNEGGALDGSNYAPGGLKLPNVITVGALDQTGDRASGADWYSQGQLQQWYDKRIAEGTLPAGTTFQQYADSLASGSNYATGDGEVTLSACGTQVPVGVDADGKPVLLDGTSFAAPQVAAAAAMLKSINPDLNADQIKQILVDNADSEVTQPDGSKVAVPAGAGGKVLRVDKAVLAVINQMLPADKQLKLEDLVELATVHLVADGGPDEYTVTASITKVGPAGADMTISMTGQGVIDGSTSQRLASADEVSWKVTLAEDSSTIKVYRSDTKTCAVLTTFELEQPDQTGPWFTVTFQQGGSFSSTVSLQFDFLGYLTPINVDRDGRAHSEGSNQYGSCSFEGQYDRKTKTLDGTYTSSFNRTDDGYSETFNGTLTGTLVYRPNEIPEKPYIFTMKGTITCTGEVTSVDGSKPARIDYSFVANGDTGSE